MPNPERAKPHPSATHKLSAANLPRFEAAERFRKAIEEAGWTQTEAGERLKVTRHHVSQIMCGNSVPSLSLLNTLENIVKSPPTVDPRVRDLDVALRRLPEREKGILLDLMFAMVEARSRRQQKRQ